MSLETILVNLTLHNFRLYSQASVSLAPGINVVVGGNAQGKSSLLEAIAFLVLGSGIRGAGAGNLLRWEEEQGGVEGIISNGERSARLAAILERGRPARHLIDEVPARLGELYRFHPVVVYWPADGEIVRGEPEVRRRFLDGLLVRLSSSYMGDLRRYRRALSQRNALLRSGRLQALDVWDEDLARCGGRLALERRRAAKALAPLAAGIYAGMAGGNEELQVAYASSWLPEGEGEDPSGLLLEAIRRSRGRDVRLGYTMVGPHRDDMSLLLGTMDLRVWASRGQQKEAALALRLAQAGLVAGVLGKQPLLLLDDVFAELDGRRRRWLGEVLVRQKQVLVTTSEAGLLPEQLAQAATFVVEGAAIKRC